MMFPTDVERWSCGRELQMEIAQCSGYLMEPVPPSLALSRALALSLSLALSPSRSLALSRARSLSVSLIPVSFTPRLSRTPLASSAFYRGTSIIRNSPPP